MKNTYLIGGQVLGPNYAGAFGQTLTITNGTLQPEHLGPGSELHKVVRSQYPELVRPTLQICVTSIYKFEDDEASDFRAEALKAAAKAEELIEREGHADYILDDLIHVLRTLS